MPIDPIDNQFTTTGAVVSLTVTPAGTADNTIADVGAAFSQATLNANFIDMAAKINAILAALRDAEIISEG